MRLRIGRTEILIDYFATAVISLMLILDRTGIMIGALLSAALHEAGHTAVILALSGSVAKVRLCPWGILIDCRDSPCDTFGYIAVQLAGPCANLAAWLILRNFMSDIAGVNLIYGLFSLLPCGGLDGGDIVSCLLGKLFGKRAAKIIMAVLTVVISLTMISVGFLLFISAKNPSLCIIGIYLLVIFILKKRKDV